MCCTLAICVSPNPSVFLICPQPLKKREIQPDWCLDLARMPGSSQQSSHFWFHVDWGSRVVFRAGSAPHSFPMLWELYGRKRSLPCPPSLQALVPPKKAILLYLNTCILTHIYRIPELGLPWGLLALKGVGCQQRQNFLLIGQQLSSQVEDPFVVLVGLVKESGKGKKVSNKRIGDNSTSTLMLTHHKIQRSGKSQL